MFKMTFFLCAALFSAMQFGGEDRGQQRLGLIAKPTYAAARPDADSDRTFATASVASASFVPEGPLMATPAAIGKLPDPAAPEPELGVVMAVNSKSVNVRSGPGKDFEVVERLVRGDTVLVVTKGDEADGWSLIRIEGDGIEGYIASRLLRE